MTRRTALVWALAALGGGTLLWSAWRILSTDLSMTGRVLAWALWLLLTAAVVTFFLYVRELVRQGVALTRGARWQPVPAVALLWLGGASSLVVFTALMPASAASARPEPVATTKSTGSTGPAGSNFARDSAATERTSSATSSRTKSRTPAPTSTSAPAGGSSTPTPSSTSSLPRRPTSTTTPPPPTTTTSTPIIDITVLPTRGKPTKPGH